MPDAASIFFDGRAQASHGGSIGGLASANNFNRLKMPRHERMAGLVRLRRSKGIWDERQDRAEHVAPPPAMVPPGPYSYTGGLSAQIF
jgi:hypothetical protein